ncbi:mitochondrial zinc maintenance protein 1, mitochondrial [Bombardia bombarda]|uniref:Mitochondrial zinc maintenance protein 1, mitochondrial n=1 Tax=Bombardia bombarda TaxID=252184 RepID=A0AA40C7X8_9PEZI|nr:mitochondrial zinc maintenance protein 1, mitochondrial [Bombardia bombarda]
MATQAYRHLMRAARVAFEGDARVFDAARVQIRQGFREKATLSATDPEVQPAIQRAEELASFLKSNVVQGRRVGDTYKLRIHEETERGDNDTVKMGGQTIKIDGRKCCSDP